MARRGVKAVAAAIICCIAMLSVAAGDHAPPNTLAFSTWHGGEETDIASDVDLDSQGNIWVGGYTPSFLFPVTGDAFQPVRDGLGRGQEGWDGFLSKFSPRGDLLYSTFLGGNGRDRIMAIAVDDDDNVFAAGFSRSANFPTTPGAYDEEGESAIDGFLAKFSSNGQLQWSTMYGGDIDESTLYSNDYIHALALDGKGNPVIGGFTFSDALPTTPQSAQPTFDQTGANGGASSGFIAKFDTDGNHEWSTYVGGPNGDVVEDIAVGTDGSVYATGIARSEQFPATPGVFQEKPALFDFPGLKASDAFVMKLAADGSNIEYATYYGGGGPGIYLRGFRMATEDWGRGIVVDDQGRATILGTTGSDTLPITPNAMDSQHASADESAPDRTLSNDGFLATFSPDGSSLEYATYIGGVHKDFFSDLDMDTFGRVVVTGWTRSLSMPTTPSTAYQATMKYEEEKAAWHWNVCDGPARVAMDEIGEVYNWDADCDWAGDLANTKSDDGFLLILDPLGPNLHYGTYFGGGDSHEAFTGVAVDNDGTVVLAGTSRNRETPVKNAEQYAGGLASTSALVTKFVPTSVDWPCLIETAHVCYNLS